MTERSESERAELVALADELDDATKGLSFSSLRHSALKCVTALRRLAAQDQKPVAWRTRWRTEGWPHEPGDWSYYNQKPPQDHKRYEVEPLYLSPPPAAGWASAEARLREALELAYGLLWIVGCDRSTPGGNALSFARKALLGQLDKPGQGRGIAAARRVLNDEEAGCGGIRYSVSGRIYSDWGSRGGIRPSDARACGATSGDVAVVHNDGHPERAARQDGLGDALSAHPHASDCDKQGETTKSVETPETNALDPASVSKQPVSGAPSSPAGRDRPSDRTADVTVDELAAMIVPEGAQVIGAQDAKQIAAEILDTFTVGRR